MWVVLARHPPPLARVWPGRTSLAIADAMGWPAAWAVLVAQLPVEVGLFGRVSVAVALLLAVRGVWTSVCHNERYRFFIRRVWSLVWPLLTLGVALQVAGSLVR